MIHAEPTMRRVGCQAKRLAGLCAAALLFGQHSLTAQHWPQWRGPSLNGVSSETGLPTRWSKTENIAWKLAMPAWSGSSPIIWGERIFLNVADGANLFLWSINKVNGEV